MDQLHQIVFRFREDANSFLSRYEPIALVTVPLIILILARATESFISAVQEKGLVRAVLAFAMVSVRMIPGVNVIIDREKKKIVEKLQSGNKKNSWRTELSSVGLGRRVIEKMEDDKKNDVNGRGRCSGTV